MTISSHFIILIHFYGAGAMGKNIEKNIKKQSSRQQSETKGSCAVPFTLQVAACLCSFVFLLVMLGTLTSGLTQRHIIDAWHGVMTSPSARRSKSTWFLFWIAKDFGDFLNFYEFLTKDGSGQRQMAALKTYLLLGLSGKARSTDRYKNAQDRTSIQITWHDMTWHDMTRHDKTWQDMTRHDKTWQDMTRHYTLLYTVASCRLFRLVSRRCRSRWSLRRQNSIPKNLTKRLCRSAKHAISGDLTPDSVQLLAVPGPALTDLLLGRVAAKKVEKTCCTGPCSFLWCELLQVGIEHVTDLLVFAETFLSLAINL